MLNTVKQIFDAGEITINDEGEKTTLHSHTSLEQCNFLQQMFSASKAKNSLEVGFAYGISTMFILEMHRKAGSEFAAHIAIEPDDYWGAAAMYNIKKEGLEDYLELKRDYSDKILPKLFYDHHRIQFAYVDSTKQFDVLLQDFYFIDKMLDVNGIIVFDDCLFPGVGRVAKFIKSLPHYQVYAGHDKAKLSFKRKSAKKIADTCIKLVPFKKLFYPDKNFMTIEKRSLDYNCIAFKKIGNDERSWDWDAPL